MTPQAFRELALAMPDVKSKAILEREVFRTGATAFATLGWPGQGWGVVKLPRREQQRLMAMSRGVTPEPGPRGGDGVTLLRLGGVDQAVACEVLAAAWRLARSGVVRTGDADVDSEVAAPL
jgi:hypothetical protein